MAGKLLNNLDRKYAFGLLTGLVFGLLSVYTDFFRSNNANIQFDILSNTTVVDLKENIGKIDILYDSVSILSKKQTLSLITVKIINNGNADVLKTFYDSHFPLGLKVNNGTILEKPTLIQSSNDYIGQSIGMEFQNKNEIRFTDFIFEKNEFFVLKLLVLHNDASQPDIISIGKIAGVKEIPVVKSYQNKETKSFWERVFGGSFLIHVTRFFNYIFSMVAFVIVIVLPITFISDKISAKKRKKKVHDYKRLTKKNLTEPESFIIKFYSKNGIYPLKRLLKVSSNYNRYKYVFRILNPNFEPEKVFNHAERRPHEMETMYLIKELKEKSYLKVENNQVVFADNLNTFINEFVQFIDTDE